MINVRPSRIAKLESGSTIDVSLDFRFRAFFAVGGTLDDLVTPKAVLPPNPGVPAARPRRKRRAKQGG